MVQTSLELEKLILQLIAPSGNEADSLVGKAHLAANELETGGYTLNSVARAASHVGIEAAVYMTVLMLRTLPQSPLAIHLTENGKRKRTRTYLSCLAGPTTVAAASCNNAKTFG